jgi:hypothetical protein
MNGYGVRSILCKHRAASPRNLDRHVTFNADVSVRWCVASGDSKADKSLRLRKSFPKDIVTSVAVSGEERVELRETACGEQWRNSLENLKRINEWMDRGHGDWR